MKNIIAVDPGQSGGIAWQINDEIGCQPMPKTEGDILELLQSLAARGLNSTVAIELLPRFTGEKVPGSRTAVLFENYGFVKGAAAGLHLRTVLHEPHDWQKFFRLGTRRACKSRTEWKNKLKGEAQRRFPGLDVTLATSDALLILEYHRLAAVADP